MLRCFNIHTAIQRNNLVFNIYIKYYLTLYVICLTYLLVIKLPVLRY